MYNFLPHNRRIIRFFAAYVWAYCKTSIRRATNNSRIFKIAKELVHETISAANNSCKLLINVANISGRAILVVNNYYTVIIELCIKIM